jgi:hypothetical protein
MMNTRMFAQAAKAIYAFFFTGLSTLVTVLVGNESFGDITAAQWVVIVLAALGAGGGVYGIRNLAMDADTPSSSPPPATAPEPPAPNVQSS